MSESSASQSQVCPSNNCARADVHRRVEEGNASRAQDPVWGNFRRAQHLTLLQPKWKADRMRLYPVIAVCIFSQLYTDMQNLLPESGCKRIHLERAAPRA